MSVRTIIILLALPLFLLLAAVNSALLYAEETTHAEEGLRGEAMAAAVTIAEFARQADDPFVDLARPDRLAALRNAARKVPDLEALYLLRPGSALLNFSDRPPIVNARLSVPRRVEVIGGWESADGRPLVIALAPDGHGAMAVAAISAESLHRDKERLRHLLIALIGGSTALAVLLGLIVGRRVGRELQHIRAAIATRAQAALPAGRGIREARELAEAVALLDKSVASELSRITADTGGDAAEGLAELRRRHMPDRDGTADGVAVSVRTRPDAPEGGVHVVQPTGTGWNVALGLASGEPAEALAAAIAARDHVLAGPPTAFAERLDLAARAFGIEWRVVATDVREGAWALTGDPAAIGAYADRLPDVGAAALADDLTILFPRAGIIVVVRPG